MPDTDLADHVVHLPFQVHQWGETLPVHPHLVPAVVTTGHSLPVGDMAFTLSFVVCAMVAAGVVRGTKVTKRLSKHRDVSWGDVDPVDLAFLSGGREAAARTALVGLVEVMVGKGNRLTGNMSFERPEAPLPPHLMPYRDLAGRTGPVADLLDEARRLTTDPTRRTDPTGPVPTLRSSVRGACTAALNVVPAILTSAVLGMVVPRSGDAFWLTGMLSVMATALVGIVSYDALSGTRNIVEGLRTSITSDRGEERHGGPTYAHAARGLPSLSSKVMDGIDPEALVLLMRTFDTSDLELEREAKERAARGDSVEAAVGFAGTVALVGAGLVEIFG